MEDPQSSRPSEYRAPTWLWASVDGEVFWTNSLRVKSNNAKKTEVIDCEVLEVNSIVSLGRVKDSTLKISAVTKEIIWDGTLIHFREGFVPDTSVASAATGVGRTAGDIIALARPEVTEETLYNENRDELNNSVPKEVVFHMVRDQECPNTVSRQVTCLVLADTSAVMLEKRTNGLTCESGF